MWVSFFGVGWGQARVEIFLWTKGGPSRESMGTSVLGNPCFTSSRHGTQDRVLVENRLYLLVCLLNHSAHGFHRTFMIGGVFDITHMLLNLKCSQHGVATEVVWSMVPFHEKETTAVRKSGGAGVIPTAETHAGQFIYDQCAVFNALRSNHTALRL